MSFSFFFDFEVTNSEVVAIVVRVFDVISIREWIDAFPSFMTITIRFCILFRMER